MQKFLFLLSLLSFMLLTCLGCESIMKSSLSTEPPSPPPKSSGYLTEGATVKIDTGYKTNRLSILEQLDQANKNLTTEKEKVASLEKEIAEQREIRKMLEYKIEENERQLQFLETLQQENEQLRKQLVNARAPYEDKIKELTLELARSRLEETKAKQELVGLKIELLVDKKKNQ
ncbi:hypothetical protein [Candidatus Kuenenia stuttgartiensis]|jgi:chromosome segregation ATPase|uniref:Uncharacterized protein n=1 Tax=Kuenenia stuttgartiensis TaxID=174633 RepID=Q1PUI9_KUEST|nr:hypothetical protein [Candidatus Kuenenia stuttgartiensis]MBE7548155.1 hypothetical protein [Planctomycetia bacterium]MCF6152620.1 hypothetical protein [Candidatus Kuenenia stuttgartiensis]GJQ49257.1 MAG: hypothetical protein HKUEN01_16430 [Candidatus Kuenenia stuttgartiensis]CAJ70893.1 unknown protein [Candidatus Kuenenia stuttgartiensis]